MNKKLLLIAATALIGCSDEPTLPLPDPKLTLDVDSVSLLVGASTTISPSITNTTAGPLFTSRDETVATVNGSGVVTGLKAGRTVVVASLAGIPHVRDSLIVVVATVPPPPVPPPPQPVILPIVGTGVVQERHTAEVAVAHPWAYTTTWGFRTTVGNAVKIWNVSGNTPILTDSLIVPNATTLGDVQISPDGNLLVVAIEGGGPQNGFVIYNRTNPAAPQLITRYVTANTRGGVHTLKLARINNRLYAFLSVNPSNTTPAKIITVDITDPANPVETHVRDITGTFVHDVFVRDGILFAALWHTGMTIYDLGGANHGGTPAAPVQLGTVKTLNCKVCGVGSSSVHNIWWFHDPTTNSKRYAFIGEEGPGSVSGGRSAGGVHVVDVSDFNNPREVAVYEPDPATTSNQLNAGAHNFVMDEPSGILYAAYYNGGVRALDVRGDLSSCTAAQKTPDGRCDLGLMGREVGVAATLPPLPRHVWGVALAGNFLYASDMWQGIYKIDISALKR